MLTTTAATTIRPLHAPDFHRGFLETLASLAPVDLTPEQAVAVFQNRLRQGTRTFVYIAGDRVVGTASLFIEFKFIHAGGRVGHVEDFAVHRDHQGRGIGRALLAHVEEKAREAGCYKLILDCHEQTAPFYEKAGFRRHELEMRKDLDHAG